MQQMISFLSKNHGLLYFFIDLYSKFLIDRRYFIINFPQRPGALKEFVSEVLGKEDDITYFQFSKKNNRES
mgnify:CR=1 FL=1